MGHFGAVASLGLPLAMLVSGIVAWKASRSGADKPPVEKPTWRDDSLDDWRRERDAEAEARRLNRTAEEAAAELNATSGKEAARQSGKHTRIGG